MKYIGLFKDINDKSYTLTIVSNNDVGTVKELLLGDTPIITEVEGSDNIFKPVKYSSATIKILSKDYMFDIYSGKALGTKVTLSEGQTIKWIGYIAPNLYNLGCEYDLENIELEAIDGLSTLLYIDYLTNKRVFKSFTDIISSILEKCNCYKYYYIPYTYQIDSTTKDHFYSYCNISESNFFDEDNTPMKCDEVLEELCKFMGLTAVAYNDSVYFLDYNGVREDLNEYYRIEIGKIDAPYNPVQISNKQYLNKDSYSENGTLISLGDTYNKISVKDSLYSSANLFPVLDDLTLLKNKNGDNQYEKTILQYHNQDPDKDLNLWTFNKFYTHPYYKECWYDKTTFSPIKDFTPKCYNDLFLNMGGTIVKNYTVSFHTNQSEHDQNNQLQQLDYSTYIVISNQKSHSEGLGTIRPLLTIDIPNPLVMGGDRTFLVLNGSVIFKRDQFDSCTLNEILYEDDLVDNNEDSLIILILAMLKVGDKYYTGMGEWTNYKTWFQIPLEANNKPTEKIHFYNNEYQFANSIYYLDNLKIKDGYPILLPDNIVTSDVIEFSLIQPIGIHPEYNFYLLKDFDASIEIANRQDDMIYESDTEYVNTIDDGYVNDFEGESFKICTWDNKESNYSSVIYNKDKPTYLDKIYNRATKEYCRSEEHYINRLLRQNSNPPYMLDISLFNNVKPYTLFTSSLFGSDKKFVVDSLSIDWRLNTNLVKLVEKK